MKRLTLFLAAVPFTAVVCASAMFVPVAHATGPSISASAGNAPVVGQDACSVIYTPTGMSMPNCVPPPGPTVLPVGAGAEVTLSAASPTVTFVSAALSDGQNVIATLPLTTHDATTATTVMPGPLPENAKVLSVEVQWQGQFQGVPQWGTERWSWTLEQPAPLVIPRIADTTVKRRGVSVEVDVPAAATITLAVVRRGAGSRGQSRGAQQLPRVLGRRVTRTRRSGAIEVWIPYSRHARRALAQRKATPATLRATIEPPGGEPIVINRALRLY
jgi:hypothetical protein